MSANVESMFSVREMPWHREGIVLGDYPGSWSEARTLAGLDWEPIEAPVYRQTGMRKIQVPQLDLYGMDGLDPIYKVTSYETVESPIIELNPDDKHIVRNDNGAILSVVSKGYTLIGHEEMGAIIEAVLGQTNVKWETAGSLNAGKAVWVLVKLDEPIELPGDDTVTYPYMAITNRHDGGGSCALRTTMVRIVCANTMAMAEAEGEKHGAVFSFRHTKNWRDHIEEAKQAVHGARVEMGEYAVMAKELLQIRFTLSMRDRFITEFIPMPSTGIITDRVMGNVERDRNNLRQIFSSTTTAEIAHTAYGAVQAASEWASHIRGTRGSDSLLNRCIMKNDPLKRKAVKLVREIASAGV